MAPHRLLAGAQRRSRSSVFVIARTDALAKNCNNMIMYATMGAGQGCWSAEAALGYCLLFGYGVAKNEVKGIRVVHESASAFCAAGM
jgi:hypothetical protein